jgi:hypothetical protein
MPPLWPFSWPRYKFGSPLLNKFIFIVCITSLGLPENPLLSGPKNNTAEHAIGFFLRQLGHLFL